MSGKQLYNKYSDLMLEAHIHVLKWEKLSTRKQNVWNTLAAKVKS